MSTSQLRAFHFVALAGGFSRAARELAIGQSTLSGQVRQLEAASGVSLLERSSRGAVLTEQGRTLFEVTSRLFAAEAEARAILRGETSRTGGHLRMAADGAFHPVPILVALRSQRPQITFSLSIANSEQVVEQLLGHRADVGITARLPTGPHLLVRPLLSMAVGVFVPTSHEWSGRAGVTLADLAGRTFVLRERGSVTREVFERNVAESGVVLGPTIEVSSREGVREIVAAGFGIGVVADREFGSDRRLTFLPVIDARHRLHEYVACLEDRRRIPLVRDFLACAEASIEAKP